jgi:hypothetical protein
VVSWSLHGEYFHGVLAFILEREHITWRRGASRGGGRICYPSVAHQERRTCQIEMRSDA